MSDRAVVFVFIAGVAMLGASVLVESCASTGAPGGPQLSDDAVALLKDVEVAADAADTLNRLIALSNTDPGGEPAVREAAGRILRISQRRAALTGSQQEARRIEHLMPWVQAHSVRR